jgi:hypothetical protein
MNPVEPKGTRRRPNGSVLQSARHPMSASDDLTNQPGHDLALGIDPRSRVKQCSPVGGSVISLLLKNQSPRQGHADRLPLGSTALFDRSGVTTLPPAACAPINRFFMMSAPSVDRPTDPLSLRHQSPYVAENCVARTSLAAAPSLCESLTDANKAPSRPCA